MIALKKVWVAFSILALGAFVVVPAVVAAQGFYGDVQPQYNANSSGGGNASPTFSGGNSLPNSSSNSQPTFTGGNTPPTNSGNNTQPSSGPGGLINPLGNVTGICQLLKIVLNILILIGIPIAMFFLVYAGFKLVFARGRPTELDAAKKNLLNTIIGIAIFLGVWFIVQVIANTLGALGVQILGDCR